MYIGIDGNEANEKERVGVNQYTYEIISGLYRLNESSKIKNNYVIFLKNDASPDLPMENDYWRYEVIKGGGKWVLTKLQPRLFSRRLDVFFTPNHYLPPLGAVPKVFAIHDLGYLEFSEQFKKHDFWQLKYWTAMSIYVSKYIITFSDFTRKDIVRHYPGTSKKVAVIHHGYNRAIYNTKISNNVVRHVQKKYKIDKPYILFLGTLKPSKNIEGLLQAYKLIKAKGFNYGLVISGKKGWMFDGIFKKVKELGISSDIVFTDFITEEDKPALIKGAKMFVLPSFWEGFGMDIITSFGCGVPVVGSNAACIPEIGGDVIIKCDPYSADSIAGAIEKVLKMSSKEYNILSAKCVRRSNDFSWDKAAKETLEVLTKASR